MTLLRMEAIGKSFGGVPALRNVTLEVAAGQVHALMGENGAGKSTLMKILSGLCRPDKGSIFLDGSAVVIKTPQEALKLGIAMIHQELSPVRELSVAANVFLGREPCYRWTGAINRSQLYADTKKLFADVGLAIDPKARMGGLSTAEMQVVEIVKAISWDSKIIIMDEPTSAIAGTEVEKLFEIIARLKARGIAIIYISHKLDEVFRVADAITVLRDGQFVERGPASLFDRNRLVRLMVGREISDLFPAPSANLGETVLEVTGLSCAPVCQDVSFTARKGEIIGFVGLMGAGRSEIMETLFGLRRKESGSVRIAGQRASIDEPSDAIRSGLAFVTEDRQHTGLNLKGSVRNNLNLVVLRQFCRFGQVLNLARENAAATKAMVKLDIRARGPEQTVGTLSGGNQQKIVLAKWLANDPQILIMDEPTRGIDIGAKAEIYRNIIQLASTGKTILLVSSEMEEVLGLSHRVLVVRGGRIVASFDRVEFRPETIMKAAMGESSAAA